LSLELCFLKDNINHSTEVWTCWLHFILLFTHTVQLFLWALHAMFNNSSVFLF
jgi:hypothetical protein